MQRQNGQIVYSNHCIDQEVAGECRGYVYNTLEELNLAIV